MWSGWMEFPMIVSMGLMTPGMQLMIEESCDRSDCGDVQQYSVA
jgi:hypothetical protein